MGLRSLTSHKNTKFSGIFIGFEADFVLKTNAFHQISPVLEGVGWSIQDNGDCSRKNTTKDVIFEEYMDRAFRLKKNQAKNISESEVMIQNKKKHFFREKMGFS